MAMCPRVRRQAEHHSMLGGQRSRSCTAGLQTQTVPLLRLSDGSPIVSSLPKGEIISHDDVHLERFWNGLAYSLPEPRQANKAPRYGGGHVTGVVGVD